MIDKELAIKNKLPDAFETILQLMERLQVCDVLPDDLSQRDFITNRALDMRSASMVYLAVIIRHHSRRGGIPGSSMPYDIDLI
jgi:hypothetical protein